MYGTRNVKIVSVETDTDFAQCDLITASSICLIITCKLTTLNLYQNDEYFFFFQEKWDLLSQDFSLGFSFAVTDIVLKCGNKHYCFNLI